MKAFKDLVFNPHPSDPNGDGIQARMEFDNGYGVSVICTPFSYGGRQGLYEMAVFHDGELTYTTVLGDDVKGWLTEDEVTELLKQIQEL
jgi:hypothetical protein